MGISKYEHNGVTGLDNICDVYGISKTTVNYRMSVKGMTLSDALTPTDLRAPKFRKKRSKVKASKENVPKVKAEKKQKDKTKRVPIKFPDLLDGLWMLALGMRERT